MARFAPLLRSLFHNILPANCVACQTPSSIFCENCIANVQWTDAPRCERCGSAEIQHSRCRKCDATISPFQAATQFADPIRPAIHALKYENSSAIAEPLGKLMAHAWASWETSAEVATAVPLHPERQRERGYNQSQLLAQHFTTEIGLPLSNDLLFRVKKTRPQVGLQGKRRRDNVRGAFQAVEPLVRGKHILLIDDVLTTGATVTESAETLYRAGAHSVTAFCLARTTDKAESASTDAKRFKKGA